MDRHLTDAENAALAGYRPTWYEHAMSSRCSSCAQTECSTPAACLQRDNTPTESEMLGGALLALALVIVAAVVVAII